MSSRWLCKWRGHRWELRSQMCLRCLRTVEEIALGRGYDPAAAKRENDAYWRGVQDGRKVDRKRAYRLGYARGGRRAFALVEEKLLAPPARGTGHR